MAAKSFLSFSISPHASAGSASIPSILLHTLPVYCILRKPAQ